MYSHNLYRQRPSSFHKISSEPSVSTSSSKIPFTVQDENVQKLYKEPTQSLELQSNAVDPHSLLSSANHECTNTNMLSKTAEESVDNGFESQQLRIAHAVAYDPTKRVLCFKPSAPYPKVTSIRKNAYQPKLNTYTVKRTISTTPAKVLDAPYLADDYYTNILDWSSKNVVAIALGTSIYLWNASNGAIQALQYNDEPVASLHWSGDGSYLAVGTTHGDTQVWDVQANKKLRSMSGQTRRIGVLDWHNHTVTSGAQDGSIFCHDVRLANQVVRKLYGHEGEVCGLKWRPDGDLLASGGNDDTVHIWDARSSLPTFQRRVHRGAVKALSWCPWSRHLLASGGGRDDQNIHFWNAATGLRMNTIHTGSQVTSLTWSQHYKEIASTHGYPHHQISVWAYPSLEKVIDIPAHDSRILHSASSPDGQVLVTAAADQNLKFWRIFEANGLPLLGSDSIQINEKRQTSRRAKGLR